MARIVEIATLEWRLGSQSSTRSDKRRPGSWKPMNWAWTVRQHARQLDGIPSLQPVLLLNGEQQRLAGVADLHHEID